MPVATSPAEIAALGAVVVLAFVVALRAPAFGARARVAAALVAVIVTSAALLRPSLHAATPPPKATPGRGTVAGYVSSSACLGCHPAEHASFHRTYHRTMTQAATASVVKAPLDGRALDLDGRAVRLERRGDEVWATLPDPDRTIAGEPAPDVRRRVVLTTGSHREQAFWVEGKRTGDLRLVPFVWMIKEGAFVARRDAFLLPPGEPLPPVRWASSCIACHAVAGQPRHDLASDAFDTRVAELGIACEACHGPGAAHVERHRDPVERYMQHASKAPDPTIVHPGRLPPSRSAAICGQCHAYAFPHDEDGFWTDGYARVFRAGDALEASRSLITHETMTSARGGPSVDAAPTSIFWADGSVRVGGREYNGLVASPCWLRGEGDRKLTCLSCHAMHEGDPAGQLAPSRAGDRACTTCHVTTPDHTHHSPGSPGAACVACHMPKTSYALLSAVRSHRIESPSVAATLAAGKPNACNLCHLDRSLAWTAERLAAWYPRGGPMGGQATPPLPADRAELAVGLRDGLAGDAAVRALVADALGSEDARRAIAPAFAPPILAELRRDPYAAVRFIADRSARAVEGAGTPLDEARLRALLAARDGRAITIAE